MTSIQTMFKANLLIKRAAHKKRLESKGSYEGREHDLSVVKEIEQELAWREIEKTGVVNL